MWLQVLIKLRLWKISYLWFKIKFRKKALWFFGEFIARLFLSNKNLLILEQNWSCAAGEIDIVAMQNRIVIFCEVKTRDSVVAKNFDPFAAVDLNKRTKIKELSIIYWQQNRKWLKRKRVLLSRFDIVTVTIGTDLKITHTEAAF